MKLTRQFFFWYLLVGVFVLVFIQPILNPARFEKPLVTSPNAGLVVATGLLLLCPLATWLALGRPRLSLRGRMAATFYILAITTICEVIHYWVTDRGHYFPAAMFADNTTWQWFMHKPILELQYGALPHSYRFFPDSIVEFYRWLCGDFVLARIAYRVLFNALLFVAVYRYARVYVSELFAGIAVALIALLYPITILKYAGQFVDPMANGGYILCLGFLASGYEAGFGPTLFAALAAKESVIVVAFCRLFYGRTWWRGAAATAAYSVIGLAILMLIRRKVASGHLEYGSISGVGLKHIPENLAGWREWILMYAAGFGTLLPGTVLGWKLMDRSFQWTAVTVVVATLISSLVFSWMSEVRNMTPAFVVLIVVNVVYLEHVFRRSVAPAAVAENAVVSP